MEKELYVYKIVNKRHGMTCYIANKHSQSKELLYYNEEDDSSRALRYATNVKSIFEDEQGTGIIKTAPIIFEEGILTVPRKNPTLIKFLKFHPDNVENGGQIFELVDYAAIDKSRAIAEELQFEAMALSRELGEKEIESVVRAVMPSRVDKMTNLEKSDWIKSFAKSNSEDFMDLAFSPEAARDNVIGSALKAGVIEFRRNNSEVFWNYKARNSRICRIPEGADAKQELEKFLMSNKGTEIFTDLEEIMKD